MTDKEIIALFADSNAQTKSLPRDKQGNYKRYFSAMGEHYQIKEVETISINRFNIYNNLSIEFAFATNFQQFYNAIVGLENDYNELASGNKAMFAHIGAKILALKESTIKTASSRFSQAMYICSIFIVSPTENLLEWDIEMAESKIDKWAKEGYCEADFLALAVCFVPQYLKLLKQNLDS